LRPAPVQTPPAGPSDLANRLFSAGRLLLDKLDPLVSARYLIAFFIGIAVTIAWQACVGPAEQVAAASSPDQQMLNAISLDTARRSIDRMATSIATLEEEISNRIDQLGTGQEQLAASQEEMTREIAKLQAAYRNMEPSLRPAPTPVQRPAQAPEVQARSDWRRQPCCQWPVSSTR
jgi:hypothetical protein